MRTRAALAALLTLAGAFATLPVGRAQTDEHEEEDKAYQERLNQRRDLPPDPKRDADPQAQLKADRAAFIAAADKAIQDSPNYTSKTTAHWQVRTDEPAVDVAGCAALLESFRTWFESFWTGRLATLPSDEIGRIYVFSSFHDYNTLLTGDPRHGDFRPAGHYNLYTDLVALYLGAIGPGGVKDTMVHEASHLLVTREVLGGRPVPPWLSEGLAVYFESTARDEKGGFTVGAVGGTRAKDRLRAFKKRLAAKPPWTAGSVVDADDPASFYGEGATERYAAAWMVIHTLFHAQGGRLARGFAGFLEGARGGNASPEALYAAVGLDEASLTAMVAAHAAEVTAR